MTWEQLAQKVIVPFGTNLKQHALELLKEAEMDFANETKCIEREGLLWTGTDVRAAGTDVPSGSIANAIIYQVVGYDYVTYNSVVYPLGSLFTGITGTTTYTAQGSGKVVVGTENCLTDLLVYMNAGFTTVTYNAVEYTAGQTFTVATANGLTFTSTGAGKVVPVTEDQWVVDLPYNYLELKERPAWNGIPLTLFDFRMNVQLRSTVLGTWGCSTPAYYFIENDQVWLYYGTDTNGRIDYSYVAYPTDTDQLGASPTIPAKYHIYLIDYAKALLYADAEKDGSFSKFMGMYVANRDKIGVQFFNSKRPDATQVTSVASSPVNVNRI